MGLLDKFNSLPAPAGQKAPAGEQIRPDAEPDRSLAEDLDMLADDDDAFGRALLNGYATRSDNTEAVVEYLRDRGRTFPYLRWLADCFDPASNSQWVAKFARRRRGSKPRDDQALVKRAIARSEAVAEIDRLTAEFIAAGRTGPKGMAIRKYAKKVGKSESAVKQILRKGQHK